MATKKKKNILKCLNGQENTHKNLRAEYLFPLKYKLCKPKQYRFKEKIMN